MITANGIQIKPTIFPDGTSQVWQLPKEIFNTKHITIDWRFENEREILDLFSLREILLDQWMTWSLEVPFLPYARQDKPVSNDNTFNLRVLAKLINQLGFTDVRSVDVHNPQLTSSLIERFVNVSPASIHKQLFEKLPDAMLVYPDEGARKRYDPDGSEYCKHRIVFEKTRDQSTGKITGHKVADRTPFKGFPKSYLILDDLCDGGATFISIAKVLRVENPPADINLYVTHGVFSKTLEPLHRAGIRVYTTDSLKQKSTTEWNVMEIFKV